MFLISACLAGTHCRYNHDHNYNDKVIEIIKEEPSLIVCPEQLGGLPTPRPPAEIAGGDGHDVLDGKAKVMNAEGEDVTELFIQGAKEVLEIVRLYGIKKAILKSGSPSCGCGKIYDGTFSGNKVNGEGVTAALLKRNGIEVVTEKELTL